MKMIKLSNRQWKELLEEIKRKGGLTTIDGYIDIDLKDGYAVGLYGLEFTLYNDSEIDAYVLENAVNSVLKFKQAGQYLGYWLDDNTLYIDVVTVVNKFDYAMKLASTFNQNSIYDFKHKRCINVMINEKLSFQDMKRITKNGGYKN